VVTLESRETTRFEHRYESGGRVSRVRGRALPLTTADVPEDWRDAPLVLLAPVIDEVDPLLAAEFTDGAVGAAAQGWLRRSAGTAPSARARGSRRAPCWTRSRRSSSRVRTSAARRPL